MNTGSGSKNSWTFKTTWTPENAEKVRKAVLKSPKRSPIKYAVALRLSYRTVRRILHEDLKFHPYKLVVVEKLNPGDFLIRKRACETFVENLPNDAVVFFSDEAHFHLLGCVNKQNMRY
ncbi:DUF4817 domain-containing protein [Nephila pilipes]|uniref:DUF4817 domain-containing protein n=1 Tax=Nephila pilipes TaxID=299642 RepID=A0A8X6TRU4_NEPPI|nr:DUF4817 domain-containing protein [Nephila pilipes]